MNEYYEVAKMIDDIQTEWRITGKKTRRNWWDVLSGGKNGKPYIIYGHEFPVLQAAQIRQGKPITKNAIKKSDSESALPIVHTKRWEDQ